MTEKVETGHAGGFIMSEANGHRSREEVTIDNGADLLAGAVLGKITASGKYVEFNPAASDGSQTAAAVLIADAKAASAEVQAAVMARDCEVNGNELVWDAGVDANEKAAAIASLASVGIIVR